MLTADRAQIAQPLVPEVRIFGGLALNYPACGGLNPEAVKVAIRMGAKIIWLPTLSAANHIEKTKTRVSGNLGAMSKGFAPRPVQVVDDAGAVRPELAEILALIAEADIILATGHLTVAEIATVVDAAVAAGVRKILVDHPELWLIGMGVEEQRALAAKGAMMEVCIRSVTAPGHGETAPGWLAERIAAVGPSHVVMATDFGQMDSPPAPEGMRWYIAQMLEAGIAPEDIRRMTHDNPARLLGI
jgi:predicted TIM-barrel fold metal-dependent hydrolase